MFPRHRLFATAPLRLLAQMAMLLPFVVMALFAPGVMPTRAADGSMQVVLCSPEGPVQMTIGPDGVPVPTQDMPRDERCSWALSHADLALLTGPVLPSVVKSGLGMVQGDLWVDYRAAHDPRGLYARGPPTIL